MGMVEEEVVAELVTLKEFAGLVVAEMNTATTRPLPSGCR